MSGIVILNDLLGSKHDIWNIVLGCFKQQLEFPAVNVITIFYMQR